MLGGKNCNENISNSHILSVKDTLCNKQKSLASPSTENFPFHINLLNSLRTPALGILSDSEPLHLVVPLHPVS